MINLQQLVFQLLIFRFSYNWPILAIMKWYISLTHFSPMFHSYSSWKRQKTSGSLMFSGGIDMEHWLKIDQCHLVQTLQVNTTYLNVDNYSNYYYDPICLIMAFLFYLLFKYYNWYMTKNNCSKFLPITILPL